VKKKREGGKSKLRQVFLTLRIRKDPRKTWLSKEKEAVCPVLGKSVGEVSPEKMISKECAS